MNDHKPIQYAVTAIVIVLILALRLRSMRGTRPLKLETLWIVPALYLGIAAFLFAEAPPTGAGWAWATLALVVGGLAGWHRGKLMRITVDPETHKLNQQASPLSVLFIVVLIALRAAIRTTIGAGDPAQGPAALVTDILVAFALGLFALTRLEMFLRARRLLEAARTVRSPA